jgi:hypothetical protein
LVTYTDIVNILEGTGGVISYAFQKSSNANEFYKVIAHSMTCNQTAVTAVTMSGTAKVGNILTAAVVPSAATVNYQWQRADAVNATYTNISGATSATYTLVAADQGKFIRVIVTGTGSYNGSSTSNASAQIAGIDTTGPTIVRVTSSLPDGSYSTGMVIPILVEFSHPVTVTGVPTLILETGTKDVTVPFDSM